MIVAHIPSEKVLARQLLRATKRIEILEKMIETTSRDLYLANQQTIREKDYIESLLESMGVSLIVVSQEGIIRQVNAETLRLLGYKMEQLIGQRLGMLLPDDDRAGEIITDVAYSQREWTYLDKDGRKIPVLLSGTPVRDKAGKVWATSCVAVDITQRKHAEGRFQVMIETSADAIMTLAPPDWSFTSGNPATVAMFQIRDERHFISYDPAQLSPEYQPDGQLSSTKAQEMIRLALQKGSHFFEWTHRRLDGQIFPATVLLARFEIAGEMQLQATVKDISKRKYTEDQLMRLSKAVECANESIVITDPQGMIQYVNPAFEKLTGYTSREALNQNPRILKSGIQSTEFYVKLWKTITSGNAWSGRLSNRAKDGSTFIEDATISPILDDNGVITNFVAVKKDITKQMELETRALQSQKLESIGQLAAGIAHEINTPIQFVGDNTVFLQRAFSSLMPVLEAGRQLLESSKQDGKITPEAVTTAEIAYKKAKIGFLTKHIPRAVEQSLEGIERVAHIVSAMKEFSHPSQGRMRSVDLNHAIETTLTVARNEWKYVAEMETDFDSTLPTVSCLRDEFNQVILNIVVNAAHAISDASNEGRDGKGVIRVTTRSDGNWAEIRIRDSGTGIPAEVQRRVFDPFFTTKKVGLGTGQGLAIARSVVVDKHAGTIDIDSEVGKGTTFIIRLPLHGADNAAKKADR